MTTEEANKRVLVHAGFRASDSNDGIGARLRPYVGIRDSDWADLLEAVIVLYPTLVGCTQIDRQLPAAFWSICETTRTLAVRLDSPIRRNKLTGDEALSRLAIWVDAFERFFIRILRGLELSQSVSGVVDAIATEVINDPASFEFFRPYLEQFATGDDVDIAEASKIAIAVLDKS